MKFSANLSLLFTELALSERVAAARRAGFNAVEVQFPYELSVEDWYSQLQENQMEMALFNVPAGDLMLGGDGLACVPGRDAEFEKALDECLSYAEKLAPTCVNVLSGRLPKGVVREAAYDIFLKNLTLAADKLSNLGIHTTFEAINTRDMPGFLIHSFEHMQQVLSELNHPNIAMQYDIYHMARMGVAQGDIIKQLSTSVDQIGHIQFADAPNRGEPGTGTLGFEGIFEAINKSAYRGYVGAEYKPSVITDQSLGWLTL